MTDELETPNQLPGLIRPPAYPHSAQQLLRSLQRQLEHALGRRLLVKQLGALASLSKSTVSRWFGIKAPPQLSAFFCFLERLHPEQRRKYMETHCRALPALDQPPLMPSPHRLQRLRWLVAQPAGLTVISGASDELRTFFLTALGHELRQLTGETALGIDLHRPRDFVPVETLSYLDRSTAPRQARQTLLRLWPRLQTATGRLILLNGVWSFAPELHGGILRCAQRNHVIITHPDALNLRTGQFSRIALRHALSLSVVNQRLRVKMRQWK